MGVTQQQVTIEHSKGLHARPATAFVQAADEFDADIRVSTADDDWKVNAKSSVQVITLGAEQGDELVIHADGEDSEQAVARLVELVKADFELSDGEPSNGDGGDE